MTKLTSDTPHPQKNTPIIAVDGPAASGKGQLGALWRNILALIIWIPDCCTAPWPITATFLPRWTPPETMRKK